MRDSPSPDCDLAAPPPKLRNGRESETPPVRDTSPFARSAVCVLHSNAQKEGNSVVKQRCREEPEAQADIGSDGILKSFSTVPPVRLDTEKRNHWIPDEDARRCGLCETEFTAIKWKHHCRVCGRVFCRECSSTRLRIPDMGYHDKVRVCDECALTRASSHSQSLQEILDVKEQINSHLKQALGERTSMVDRFRTFLLEIESEALGGCTSTAHSDDSFESLMQHSEAGLRKLVGRVNELERGSTALKAQIQQLQTDTSDKDICISDLVERLRQADRELIALHEISVERDDLRNVSEEQRRLLAEQHQQLEGFKMRCTALENAQKKWRESSRERGTTLPSSGGSGLSYIFPSSSDEVSTAPSTTGIEAQGAGSPFKLLNRRAAEAGEKRRRCHSAASSGRKTSIELEEAWHMGRGDEAASPRSLVACNESAFSRLFGGEPLRWWPWNWFRRNEVEPHASGSRERRRSEDGDRWLEYDTLPQPREKTSDEFAIAYTLTEGLEEPLRGQGPSPSSLGMFRRWCGCCRRSRRRVSAN